MISTLSTNIDEIDVTTRSVDQLAIDFAADVNDPETIASATAVLLRTTAVSGGSEVVGFVTDTDVDETSVLVDWTGEVLTVGATYLLVVAATLDTGAVVPSLTEIHCIA